MKGLQGLIRFITLNTFYAAVSRWPGDNQDRQNAGEVAQVENVTARPPGQAQGNAEARGFALGQDQRLKPAPSSSLTWDRSFQLVGQTKWGA
jgi:hypothetical protein